MVAGFVRYTMVLVSLLTIVAVPAHGNERPAPRKILFDTDPGGDDIFALLWLQSLATQRQAEIVAVTTVGGNVGSRQTFSNASQVLALGGFSDVPLARSANTNANGVDAEHIHGRDGMGNLSKSLPEPTHDWEAAPRADEVIVNELKKSPGEVTVVAVGPLTNLAAAERRSPGVLRLAKEVVIMGGAFVHRGNVTSQAEFNIYCDPEAAEVVFANRDDIVVLPLDVTTKVNFGQEHVEALVRADGRLSSAAEFIELLTQFLIASTQTYRETEGQAAFHVHDAATLAYLYHPQTLLMRRAEVRVETKGTHTRGQTVFDQRHGAKMRANAWVAQQVDGTNLLAILVEDLKVLCSSR